jgi:uncharacterized membrane protein (UPF0182 family)
MPDPSRKDPGAEPRRGGSNRGRTVLAVVVVLLVLLALSLRAIATFWTDFLWFDTLDLTSVWRRLLSAKVTLGVATTLVFFVLLWGNLVLADRLAPRFRSVVGPDDELLVRYRELVAGRQRVLWLVVSLLIAIVPGFSASAQWREWLLFRYGGDFGTDDPQFGWDIGFYVFKLPFLSTVVDWMFGFLLVTAVVVGVVHYLNGAIRVQPLGERITPNAKAHLSVLLALAAFTKAVDYWLQRFELMTSGGADFDGAGYTDINASLPAVNLMILISVFAGLVLLVNIRRKGWAVPVITIALWGLIAIVAGGIYPAFVQRFQVEPAELAKERPFIEKNIEATRTALGLSDIAQDDFDYDPTLTAEAVESESSNLANARLLDPAIVLPTIQDSQVDREYYEFRDVDVDRYDIAGARTPVVISARELNLDGVTNPTWEKLHLVFTHGYAAALAPANQVDALGEPEFLVQGIPPRTTDVPALEQPEIYVGEDMGGYAIVGTKQTELSTDNVTAEYDGLAGVPIDSTLRRAAFALRFGEIEPLISDSITDDSQVIYRRDVVERVRDIAPFLVFDQDPYPILHDGRVQYLVDAYTTTGEYPYAQTVDATEVSADTSGSFNYIRNSVKALVDSYDGTVSLYLTDELYGEQDPIIRAYVKAFPGMFTEDIPDTIKEHFRYPEFMFKTQTFMWGRYHQSDPSTFFNNSDRWIVAQQPSDSGAGAQQADTNSAAPAATQTAIEPYYQELRIGSAETSEFVLTRPFVLSSGDGTGRNLTSVMIARNDPSNYGKLEELVMVSGEGDDAERNSSVYGPVQANRRMVTYVPVTEFQTLTGQRGSTIRYGNILILPFGNSLVYLRPVYVAQEGSSRYTLSKIVMLSGEDVGFGDNVEQALADLLDGDPDGAVGVPAEPEAPAEDTPTEGESSPTTTVPGDDDDRTATELIQAADEKFAAADAQFAAGDPVAYAELVAEARALVAQAAELLAAAGGSDSAATGSTTTTAAP